MVNGGKSDFQKVVSGFPHGNVLGLLIFLILIEDIDKDIIHIHLKSLAVDTGAIKSIKPLFKVTILQKKLDIICLLYTSPSPRDQRGSRMPSSA